MSTTLEVTPVEPQPVLVDRDGYRAWRYCPPGSQRIREDVDIWSPSANWREDITDVCDSGAAGIIEWSPHKLRDTRTVDGQQQVCVKVECRKVDSITEEEAVMADCFALGDCECTAARQFELRWERDHPAYPWGSWAWFRYWEPSQP